MRVITKRPDDDDNDDGAGVGAVCAILNNIEYALAAFEITLKFDYAL